MIRGGPNRSTKSDNTNTKTVTKQYMYNVSPKNNVKLIIATRCVPEPDVAISKIGKMMTPDDVSNLAITFDGCIGL